ncbi:Limb region 1 homolog-like protein, partial [Geodia barretti]
MAEEAGVEDWERQRVFYDTVRESIICLLVFLSLYLGSYCLVTRFQRHFSREDCYTDQEDQLVYRITTWLCSFALSVSAASALLLPLSIVSNEVIVLYPTSDYVQWLNPSLIKVNQQAWPVSGR